MNKFILSPMLVTFAFCLGDFRPLRAAQPQASAAQQKAILDITERFQAAWNRGDAAAMAALFSLDGEFVSPSGAVTSDRGEIRNLLTQEFQETFHRTTLSPTVDTIHFVKDDAVLAKGTYKLKGVDVFLGFETSVNGSFIFRLKKTDGRWMIEKAYILRS